MAKLSVQPGAVIDGFTVGECVHRGGMATLWSVTRPDLTSALLMKIPRVSEGEDPAAIVSFEMEQMIMPRLSGPHVPACQATGDFARQAYVEMEAIPGKTLFSRLDDLPLPYEEARNIGWEVAGALADLHRQNVIHHDIKPSSVMFRPSGEAVLIDFGLSHHNQLPDLFRRNSTCPLVPRLTLRRSACSACATIRAAICSRLACCSISSRPACVRSARARRCAACGGGCGAIRIRRANCGPTTRPGCRKWFCDASRSNRPGAIRLLHNWPSISPTPTRSD